MPIFILLGILVKKKGRLRLPKAQRSDGSCSLGVRDRHLLAAYCELWVFREYLKKRLLLLGLVKASGEVLGEWT